MDAETKNDNQQRLGGLADARLYGILDLGYVEKKNLESVARELIAGGAGILQLRAKGCDAENVRHIIERDASNLVEICRESDVPLIINDYPEVAVAVGASGVHVGQDDGSLQDVRNVVGEDMIVGRSTHSVEQAKDALAEGFDYIGFGPLFPTPTKLGRPGIGLENIGVVMESVGNSIPVFCIGGIKEDNLELVLASGARRVVIVSALLQADSVDSTAQTILKSLNAHS